MIDRLPLLWCIPLNVTEACLRGGSSLARRLPDALARTLARSGAMDARWAPVVVEVDEGFGYAVQVGPPEAIDPSARLWELGGDFLCYGLLEVLSERLSLETRVYGADRGETLLYRRFAGTHAELLAWTPGLVREIAEAIGQRDLPWDAEWLGSPATRSWEAFNNYCEALDLVPRHDPARGWEWRALARLYDALRADPAFELAVELGAEIADLALSRGEAERAADIAAAVLELAPDSPAAADLNTRMRRRMG